MFVQPMRSAPWPSLFAAIIACSLACHIARAADVGSLNATTSRDVPASTLLSTAAPRQRTTVPNEAKLAAKRERQRADSTVVRTKDLPAPNLIPSDLGHPGFDASHIEATPQAPPYVTPNLSVTYDGRSRWLKGKTRQDMLERAAHHYQQHFHPDATHVVIRSSFRVTQHEPLLHAKARLYNGQQEIEGAGITSTGVPYDGHHLFLAPGTSVKTLTSTAKSKKYYRAAGQNFGQARTFTQTLADASAKDENLGKGWPGGQAQPLASARPSIRLFEDFTGTTASGRMLPASHEAQARIPDTDIQHLKITAPPLNDRSYVDILAQSARHYVGKYHPQASKVTIVKGLNTREDEPIPHVVGVLYKKSYRKGTNFHKIPGGGFSSTGVAYAEHKIYQKPGTAFKRNGRIIQPIDPGPRAHVHSSRYDLDDMFPDSGLTPQEAVGHYASSSGNKRLKSHRGNNLEGLRIVVHPSGSASQMRAAQHGNVHDVGVLTGASQGDVGVKTTPAYRIASPAEMNTPLTASVAPPMKGRRRQVRDRGPRRRVRVMVESDHAGAERARDIDGSVTDFSESDSGRRAASPASARSPGGLATARLGESASLQSSRSRSTHSSATSPPVGLAGSTGAPSAPTPAIEPMARVSPAQDGHQQGAASSSHAQPPVSSPAAHDSQANAHLHADAHTDTAEPAWLREYTTPPGDSPQRSGEWRSGYVPTIDLMHHSPEWAWHSLPNEMLCSGSPAQHEAVPAATPHASPPAAQPHLADDDWIEHLMRTPPRVHLP